MLFTVIILSASVHTMVFDDLRVYSSESGSSRALPSTDLTRPFSRWGLIAKADVNTFSLAVKGAAAHKMLAVFECSLGLQGQGLALQWGGSSPQDTFPAQWNTKLATPQSLSKGVLGPESTG